MIPTITRDALKALIDSDRSLTLIECLPEKYFAAEHLPGAIHIPHDEIATRAGMLIPNQHEPIVVYCATHYLVCKRVPHALGHGHSMHLQLCVLFVSPSLG